MITYHVKLRDLQQGIDFFTVLATFTGPLI